MTDSRTTSARLVLTSEAQTEALGQRIGEVAKAGLVIGLYGELGAGKTALVRGLARGMALDGRVRSPTFTIASLHRGAVPLLHVDAYRLDDPAELALHGWQEWHQEGVIAVEWADRVESILPARRLRIDLAHGGEGLRQGQIRLLGEGRGDAIEDAFLAAIVC
ncbi:MAG: tRNA (adenosine(37)-N6)-threonylcarbamoyltransferase complex ATPase subunit type 1 TsaE [Planctomycetota bacterium]|nr:tRNA (adenosine(37)-N6)-threonylcarbamoyltransferase complex ATPase subunit type 1 TsaE [Planctomycetota bacterium]